MVKLENKLAFIRQRFRKKRNKYGHWLIHLVITSLVVGLWYIDEDVLKSEASEVGRKIFFLTALARAIAVDLTVTAKTMITLVAGLAALAIAIYASRRKST